MPMPNSFVSGAKDTYFACKVGQLTRADRYRRNNILSLTPTDLEIFAINGYGPEDVLVLANGNVLTGLQDGRLIEINADFTNVVIRGQTGGRPLGLEHLPDGRIAVCDALKGLLAVDLATGAVDVLADTEGGESIKFCNNAAVAADGTVYFSTSTQRYQIDDASRDVIEALPTGRLMRRLPDGRVEQLLDGLYFANGVIISPDQEFVLVAETGKARIQRYWLTGTKRGHAEIFVDDLPGLPDNLSLGSDGNVWVALVTPASDMFRKITALPFALRWVVARLPEFLKPKQFERLHVVAFGLDGSQIHDFVMENGPYQFVTGVREQDGVVYLGSLNQPSVAKFTIAGCA